MNPEMPTNDSSPDMGPPPSDPPLPVYMDPPQPGGAPHLKPEKNLNNGAAQTAVASHECVDCCSCIYECCASMVECCLCLCFDIE